MKILSFFGMAAVAIFMLQSEASAAGQYPDFYVRGSEISNNAWSADENNKFTRNGDVYTIHLDYLNNEFKISNADWTINYGVATSNQTAIITSAVVGGKFDGPNYYADKLWNVDISFTYTGNSYVDITFIVDGKPVPDYISTLLSGKLPVLYINVYTDETHTAKNNEIIDKDLSHKNYFSFSEYWLDVDGCEWALAKGLKSVGSKDEPLPLEIKARGNYTRTGFSKKPFKLKLGKKQNLLGLTPEKSKHYAILAHADDNKGYLRNFVGFNLGKRIGLPWTPGMEPIEVVINGDYRGIYFLTESIRVGDGRVPITELADNETDPKLISGGYLIELDNYDEENQIRFTEKPWANGDPTVRVTFDTPEEYSSLQYQFVSDQFNAINDLIGAGSEDVWKYIDLDDAARYYLVEEIISHTESYHGSTYMYRDYGDNQKWHFSPLWDCGNAFNGPTNNHLFNSNTYGNTWIHTLINDKKFFNKVVETWKWFMSNCYNGLIDDIDEYVAKVQPATRSDRNRWGDAPRPNSGNASYVVDNTNMKERRDEVVDHLDKKIEWMRGKFGNYNDALYAEPERDATPAAELPAYVVSGVDEVEVIDIPEANVEYYSMQGIRVENPTPGVYISVSNGKSQKVVIK